MWECHKSQKSFYATVIHLIWKKSLIDTIQSAFSWKKISVQPSVPLQITEFSSLSSWFEIHKSQFHNTLARTHITVDILATATGVCQFLKLLSFPLRWCYFRYIPKALKKNVHSLLPSQIITGPQSYWEPIVFRLLLNRQIVCTFP